MMLTLMKISKRSLTSMVLINKALSLGYNELSPFQMMSALPE